MKRIFARLRADEGFGLTELLVAVFVLNIGLLGLMTAFVNGVTTSRRSSRVVTASTLADTQMELYRSLLYSNILLDTTSVPASPPYTTDAAYNASMVVGTCSGSVSSNPQCNASRTVTGPDHGTYRVDTYIASATPTNGRTVKQVTIVVRDSQNLAGPALSRRSSVFDASTAS